MGGYNLNFAGTLARLRKERKLTQRDVANFINEHTGKSYGFNHISNWENGVAMPPVDLFLVLCELYEINDVLTTFRGHEYRGLNKLNALGKSRAEEYIAMLCGNPLFVEADSERHHPAKAGRVIRLYDTPAAAGTGSFLDGDSYEDFEVDETVPKEVEFAVKVSGDSMTPRFVDGQIVFIKEQQTLAVGEIGIFGLDGDSYIKKLGRGELVSLNPMYEPIKIHECSSFYTFGKVLG